MTSFASHFRHPVPLGGRHTTFACEKCHTRGISQPGLNCDSCHHRPHPYYGPCLKCHTMTSFASNFSHPVKLAGVHTTFACSRCHVNGIGSPGVSCTRCHGSNHGGLTNCAQCHTQAGWTPTTFSHGNTGMDGLAADGLHQVPSQQPVRHGVLLVPQRPRAERRLSAAISGPRRLPTSLSSPARNALRVTTAAQTGR